MSLCLQLYTPCYSIGNVSITHRCVYVNLEGNVMKYLHELVMPIWKENMPHDHLFIACC